MLSPEYLATFPDYIVELFEQYDAFVISDFARRVAKAGRVTETAEWQAIRAHEMGLAMDELTEKSAELLNLTQEDLKAMYRDAYNTYVESDKRRFANSGLDYARIASSKTMLDYMRAAQKQTQRSLRNIVGHPNAIKSMTGTKATMLKIGKTYQPMRRAYTMALDLAQMQVSSGVLDYNTAIRAAIRSVAQIGVSTTINDAVGYDSGYHLSVRSAARMCVLTGVNQMAGQMNDLVCDELGLDLVEVTAHIGARPSHQEWQGQIFSRSGTSKVYPELASSTGLGTVSGLMGAYCRHQYYGWFEGAPRAYSEKDLYALTEEGGPQIEYEGKTYTYYEASQKQREMERRIISTKRELIGYNAAGDTEAFQAASIKLRRQKEHYRDFSRASGIRPEFARTQQDGYDRHISGKTSWAVRKQLANPEKYGIIRAVTGARITDQYGKAANAHAERYYGLVRSMTTDVSRIAENTGFSKKDVRQVKQYLFMEEHDLGEGRRSRFDSDFAIAQSWQRLIDGKPERHDLTLLKHEIMERNLVKNGMSQNDAHIETSKTLNYKKEADDYYGTLRKNKNNRKKGRG